MDETLTATDLCGAEGLLWEGSQAPLRCDLPVGHEPAEEHQETYVARWTTVADGGVVTPLWHDRRTGAYAEAS